ncbi:hypothetical protein [Rhizobium sp. BK399]|uniref:hypothetical protein n=1 Tax=Rhizobium sp. BK399 TaxID=2587063 RepID=UPI00161A4243|nr:hypothetical protein [Rhizobium sp. BK399]MBB3543829.1 hypothetical protein [Rhizobium sp. BK399]
MLKFYAGFSGQLGKGTTNMFIVAVSDNGQERNIVANEVILSNGKVLVQAGGQRHEFAIAALIDVVPVQAGIIRCGHTLLQRGPVLN